MTLTTFHNVSWNAPFYEELGYEIIEVGSDRPELIRLVADERQIGLHQAPRVAMRKLLPSEKQGFDV